MVRPGIGQGHISCLRLAPPRGEFLTLAESHPPHPLPSYRAFLRLQPALSPSRAKIFDGGQKAVFVRIKEFVNGNRARPSTGGKERRRRPKTQAQRSRGSDGGIGRGGDAHPDFCLECALCFAPLARFDRRWMAALTVDIWMLPTLQWDRL